MEGTEVQPFIYMTVVGVVLFVVLVFTFGFRSSSQPPSSMFEDENEKRNRRGRRVKKLSGSDTKPSTNGHAKLLSDSPKEVKQVKGQPADPEPEKGYTPKISPKKDKPAKSKGGEVHSGKEQELLKKDVAMKNEKNAKENNKEKDEGDVWITVTATSRKEKKQGKQTSVQNGEAAKSPKVSSKASGDPQKATKEAKERAGRGEKMDKETARKDKGSPKKIVENQIKVASVPVTKSAPIAEPSPEQGRKKKKKGQGELQEPASQTTGLTNGSAAHASATNQKKEEEDADSFTPGKSRRNRKKQKQMEDSTKQLPADGKDQKPSSSSPQVSPAKKSGKSPDKTSSPSKSKPTGAKAGKNPSGLASKEEASSITAKNLDGNATSTTKNQKSVKKDEVISGKPDSKKTKDKKSTKKTNDSSNSSSADASPAKPKSSPSKSTKKASDEKPSQGGKKQNKQPQDPSPEETPTQTVNADAKSKNKKKGKKNQTQSSPETTPKQPPSPKQEPVHSVGNNKTNEKKKKRRGAGESAAKPSQIVNGDASHSLPPSNAKDVPSAKPVVKNIDRPLAGSQGSEQVPQTAPVAVQEVPAIKDNDNWIEAKLKKTRKKVRRDL